MYKSNKEVKKVLLDCGNKEGRKQTNREKRGLVMTKEEQ